MGLYSRYVLSLLIEPFSLAYVATNYGRGSTAVLGRVIVLLSLGSRAITKTAPVYR